MDSSYLHAGPEAIQIFVDFKMANINKKNVVSEENRRAIIRVCLSVLEVGGGWWNQCYIAWLTEECVSSRLPLFCCWLLLLERTPSTQTNLGTSQGVPLIEPSSTKFVNPSAPSALNFSMWHSLQYPTLFPARHPSTSSSSSGSEHLLHTGALQVIHLYFVVCSQVKQYSSPRASMFTSKVRQICHARISCISSFVFGAHLTAQKLDKLVFSVKCIRFGTWWVRRLKPRRALSNLID